VDLRDEDWDIEEVRTGATSDPPVETNATHAPSVGPVTSEVEAPIVAQRKPGIARLVALVGIAATLAFTVAFVATSRFARQGAPPASVAVARAPERGIARAPEAKPALPGSPPAAPASPSEAATPAPAVEAAVEPAPGKPSSTVLVTIKTIPEEAVVFRAGERLGAGVVEVTVERNAKQRFTAVLDGYSSADFTLDGLSDSVTVRLKRAGKRQAVQALVTTPSGSEPNSDAIAAAAMAPAAPPESTVASEPAPAPAPTTAAAAEVAPAAARSPEAAPHSGY
jgi:hypothetical protein